MACCGIAQSLFKPLFEGEAVLKLFSLFLTEESGIAQALLNDPALLIVDEPTAGLDPEERIHFRNLLADLGARRTAILSTHIVEAVAQTCRHLAILKSGRVVFRGESVQLMDAARGKVWTFATPARVRNRKVTSRSSRRCTRPMRCSIGSSVMSRSLLARRRLSRASKTAMSG
ncbi:MAG: hypothetical protein ACRDHP_06555 [Ktedonobacterales bacterium]